MPYDNLSALDAGNRKLGSWAPVKRTNMLDAHKSRAYQFATTTDQPRQPTTDNMATTKTIQDFPGAYSGQGRSWERMVRGQIEVLLREHHGEYGARYARATVRRDDD